LATLPRIADMSIVMKVGEVLPGVVGEEEILRVARMIW
jgi:hypothetical protein